MDEKTAESLPAPEIEIYYESEGNKRYLCCNDGGHIAKERVPLNVYCMPEGEDKLFHMKSIVTKVKRKIYMQRVRVKRG